MLAVIFILFLIIVAGIFYVAFHKKAPLPQPGAEIERQILQEHVLFYQRLSEGEKIRFEKAMRQFLDTVSIIGIKQQ